MATKRVLVDRNFGRVIMRTHRLACHLSCYQMM